MKKNDIIQLEITDIGINGEGIGKADGLAFFVKNGVLRDTVEAVVTKMNKGYGYAKVLKVLKPSEFRVCPECSEAERCGGCQIQTLSYEAQLEFKQKKVAADLERIGGFKVALDTVFPDSINAQQERSTVKFPNVIRQKTKKSEEQKESSKDKYIKITPVIGMETPYMYRNKAQYPIGLSKDGKIVTGFFAGRTHSIIQAENCKLGPEGSGEILDMVIQWMEKNNLKPYDEVTGRGLVRHVLIRKSKAGDFMVCLIVNSKKLSFGEELVKRLSVNPHIKSISYNIQESKGNTILGEKVVTLYGDSFITDTIGDLKFRISPLSFYQVNPVQTEKLYGKALEFADLKGNETVWDLYCGIGTISLFLSRKAGRVYGVEIVPDAIRDAKENARLNGIENAEFFCGKAEEVVPELIGKNANMPKLSAAISGADSESGFAGKSEFTGELKPENMDGVNSNPAEADMNETDRLYRNPVEVETKSQNLKKEQVVVVDPPRKGCDPVLLEAILKIAPSKIVYVSCNPSTLARDLKILCEKDYEIKKVQPVDMFPHTVHVEVVVLLSRV